MAGEAASHCVAATVEHLFAGAHADGARRVVLLADCMSPVRPDSKPQAEAFFDDAARARRARHDQRRRSRRAGAPLVKESHRVHTRHPLAARHRPLQVHDAGRPSCTAFPQNQAVYEFVCRNEPALSAGRARRRRRTRRSSICARCSFSEDELAYLAGKRYIKSDFIDFLRIFRLQRRYITRRARGDTLWSSAPRARRST